MIFISNLADLDANIRRAKPSHLVSLCEGQQQPPTPPGLAAALHLRVEIDDITEERPGLVAPADHHISSLVEFLEGWTGGTPLLVHCIAGISRSTAAALIALTMKSKGPEADLARTLRAVAPHAQPNARMVSIADRLLGRNGRLTAAREAMGPAVIVMRGPLVALPLAA